ncbi:MAG: glycosyltransferase family 2 protein [Ferruginibacter sp.]
MFISSLPDVDEEKKFFTVLIPAHNEGRLIPAMLESLNKQTYSKTHYQVVVVADRCVDNTAELTRKYGAVCLERFTDIPSNKHEALRYAMHEFNFAPDFNEGYVCIIDADCEADPDFLREMNLQLTKDPKIEAMQSYRFVKNKYESTVTVLDGAAEALRNWVFCAPRKWLGASVFVNGSGVLFKKPLFEKLVDLPGHSLAEDKEWKAYLSERNIKVNYCPCARLSYEAVASEKGFQHQRKRWIGSHIDMIKRYGWKTLIQSVLNLNFNQFDFFCSLMQIPRSLLLAFTILFCTMDFFVPQSSLIPHWGWMIFVIALILYGMLGLKLSNARRKDYLSMPYVLSLVSGIVKTTFLSFAGKSVSNWDATRQSNE